MFLRRRFLSHAPQQRSLLVVEIIVSFQVIKQYMNKDQSFSAQNNRLAAWKFAG